MEWIGRALSASCTRNAEPARRPAASTRERSALNSSPSRSAVETAPFGDLLHPFQEERQPRLPVALAAHPVQELIVGRAILLEVEAQVEQGLAEDTGVAQEETDQQAADPSIAVEERFTPDGPEGLSGN